jgi:hypothetical protein
MCVCVYIYIYNDDRQHNYICGCVVGRRYISLTIHNRMQNIKMVIQLVEKYLLLVLTSKDHFPHLCYTLH